MIYVASPYSHPDPAIRKERFQAVCRAAAELMRRGEIVFAPIVASHPLVVFGLPTDWTFWERFDHERLKWCDELVVLMGCNRPSAGGRGVNWAQQTAASLRCFGF